MANAVPTLYSRLRPRSLLLIDTWFSDLLARVDNGATSRQEWPRQIVAKLTSLYSMSARAAKKGASGLPANCRSPLQRRLTAVTILGTGARGKRNCSEKIVHTPGGLCTRRPRRGSSKPPTTPPAALPFEMVSFVKYGCGSIETAANGLRYNVLKVTDTRRVEVNSEDCS